MSSAGQLPNIAPAPQQLIANPNPAAAAMQAGGQAAPGQAASVMTSPGGQPHPMQPQMGQAQMAAPGQFIMAPPQMGGQTAQYTTMPQIATYNQQGQLVLQPAGSYAFQVHTLSLQGSPISCVLQMNSMKETTL